MSAGSNGTARGSADGLERAQGRPGGEALAPAHTGAALARLADFAARRAELATEEAVYLAELARTADPSLAAPADPSVHASVATGFHPEPAEYLTQVALAELLDTHPRTIRRMELAGELPEAIEIGRLKRWRRSEIQTWLDDGRPKPRRRRAR